MTALLLAVIASVQNMQTGTMLHMVSGRDGFSVEFAVPEPSFTVDGEVCYPEIRGFSMSMIEGDLLRPALVFYVPLPGGTVPAIEYSVTGRRTATVPPRSRPAVTPFLEGSGLSTIEVYPESPSAPPPAVFEVEVVRALGVDLAMVTFYPFDGGDYSGYASGATLRLSWDAVPGAEVLSRSPLDLICPGGVLWWPPRGERSDSPFWGMPWARIEILQPGCYVMTGSALDSAGIGITGAPSSSVRLFTGPGTQFDPDVHDETHSLEEAAILVLDGGDGTFDPADSILFIGRSLSRFEPTQSAVLETIRLFHRYDLRNVYWLTWGGEPGRRMASVPAAPDGSPAWPGDLTSILFIEQEAIWFPDKEFDTGWVWTKLSSSFSSYFAFLAEQVSGRADLEFSLVPEGLGTFHHRFYLGGEMLADTTWSAGISRVFRLEDVPIIQGTNTFRIETVSGIYSSYDVYFDNLSVSYPRSRQDAGGADLLPTGAPAGRYNFGLQIEGSGPAMLFDCSNHLDVRILTGVTDVGGLTGFSLYARPGSRLLAVRGADLRTPSSISEASPGRIVGTLSGADAVIIAADELLEASAPLAVQMEAEGRSVALVALSEVYDEFGQGVSDPGAIRSFVAWTLDSWDPVPSDLVFVGDGHYDPLNRNTPEPVLFPAWILLTNGYSSGLNLDDCFAMTTAEQYLPEVPLSRIPADSPQDVSVYLSKTAAYRSRTAAGEWCNRVLLTADDEWGQGMIQSERAHTRSCELLSDTVISPSFERSKFYLVEYPWPGTGTHPFKPEAREDYVEELARGWLAVFFFGHGSHDQICHEKLLITSDIARIDNGPRQPLMTFASCDVGHFDLISTDCMAEEFVLRPGAGAVMTIAATRGTPTGANENLFSDMASILLDTSTVRTSHALWAAKMLNPANNTFQYILFGDGTLELCRPDQGSLVEIEGGTLRRGRLNSLLAPFPVDGTARVRVVESGAVVDYTCLSGHLLRYLKFGSTAFSGSFPTSGGILDTEFFMPLQSDTGAFGRASALCQESRGQTSDWREWIAVVDSGGHAQDSLGPLIELSLAGCRGAQPVSGPEPVLLAQLSDPSGICAFGGAAGRAILINLDSQAFDLSQYFAYEPGSSTDGGLEYRLPSLVEGTHRVIMVAWDGMGNASRDTLDFSVVDAPDDLLDEFVVYPNPGSGPMCFSFRTAAPGTAEVSIHTVAGRRIWRTSRELEAGYCQILWDGLDADGDLPASGAYLYLLRFEGGSGSETMQGVIGVVRD